MHILIRLIDIIEIAKHIDTLTSCENWC